MVEYLSLVAAEVGEDDEHGGESSTDLNAGDPFWMEDGMCLGSAALELFGFEDDQVLVEGLQGGVGQAGTAVEDRPADEDHVEPLDERAGGEAVEDGLLVEAAGVEVGVAEGGHQRGVLEALLFIDELGFHGGVGVVLGDPVGDALGEREVIERVAQIGYRAFDFDYLVDGAGVAAALGADEADVVGGDLGVLEPGAEEEVAAAEAEAGDLETVRRGRVAASRERGRRWGARRRRGGRPRGGGRGWW